MLTQVQALKLAEYNIHVNAVCPGYTNTELLHRPFQTRASDGTRRSGELQTNPSGKSAPETYGGT